MPADTNRFFVITGGSGKSTLIAVLKKAGYHTSDEVGRQIIKDQVSIWGPAVPRTDPALFAEMMLSWEMQNYRWLATQPGTVFFDRGIPDVIGYLSLNGLAIPAHMAKSAEIFRYNSRVFIAPPWPEIFRQDSERKQTVEEAERTYHALAGIYVECGYELMELPRSPVDQRVRFVLDSLGGA